MIIEKSLSPNCSEAVLRFKTLDPKEIHDILQAIADEISANNDLWGKQKVPLFKTAEEYDTNYGGKPSYAEMYSVEKTGTKEVMSEEEASKKAYPKGALLKACAGLGDNEAVITLEKDKGSFRLNIGNNDIADNKTRWVEKIKKMKIKVEEAETTRDLQQFARDCTCGQSWGF